MVKVAPAMKDFSDDPEMFSAIYDVEAGKTEDINQSIRFKTELLTEQLAALQLKNGSTQRVAEMLRKSLSK